MSLILYTFLTIGAADPSCALDIEALKAKTTKLIDGNLKPTIVLEKFERKSEAEINAILENFETDRIFSAVKGFWSTAKTKRLLTHILNLKLSFTAKKRLSHYFAKNSKKSVFQQALIDLLYATKGRELTDLKMSIDKIYPSFLHHFIFNRISSEDRSELLVHLRYHPGSYIRYGMLVFIVQNNDSTQTPIGLKKVMSESEIIPVSNGPTIYEVLVSENSEDFDHDDYLKEMASIYPESIRFVVTTTANSSEVPVFLNTRPTEIHELFIFDSDSRSLSVDPR